MVIGGSGISSLSVSSLARAEAVVEPVKALIGNEPVAAARFADISVEELSPGRGVTVPAGVAVSGRIEERAELTRVALAMVATLSLKPGAQENEEATRAEPNPVAGPYTYKLLIESMTGRRLKVMDLDRTEAEDVDLKGVGRGEAGAEDEAAAERPVVEFGFKEVTVERQHLLFKAGGVVRSASGAERGFIVKLRLSRSVYSETKLGFTAADGQPVEAAPPVSNTVTGETTVTASKYLFDLRQVSGALPVGVAQPSPSSNENDTIIYGYNGSEGVVKSGGGLVAPDTAGAVAPYGAGGEYWADESDAVYNSLRVLVEGTDGEQTLVSLKEVGIAAISLRYTDTTFSIKETAGSTDTVVKRTALLLNAKYGGGTVRQVDFVV